MCEQLKSVSERTFNQAGFLSRVLASNSCRKKIPDLSKLCMDNTPGCKVVERQEVFFSFLGNNDTEMRAKQKVTLDLDYMNLENMFY